MDVLSIKDVAEQLGVSTVRVLQMIQEGSLPAQKIGRDWFIKTEDAEAAKDRPRRGRPAKAKREHNEKELK